MNFFKKFLLFKKETNNISRFLLLLLTQKNEKWIIINPINIFDYLSKSPIVLRLFYRYFMVLFVFSLKRKSLSKILIKTKNKTKYARRLEEGIRIQYDKLRAC